MKRKSHFYAIVTKDTNSLINLQFAWPKIIIGAIFCTRKQAAEIIRTHSVKDVKIQKVIINNYGLQ